ncbi:hypothetical protein OIU77_026303 [Salix suchowensis]|uniref:Uncharacterized protein n=1 Tax=Salix suchowensis TaxID=1278906 RepID=A0ABQ8ZGG0_9ROSI|nr:hypothetical protein OIU77_026303 [Salix suchowensis]
MASLHIRPASGTERSSYGPGSQNHIKPLAKIYNYQQSSLAMPCMKQGTDYLGPMSLKAQICSSRMEDITVTTSSFPLPNPSLI